MKKAIDIMRCPSGFAAQRLYRIQKRGYPRLAPWATDLLPLGGCQGLSSVVCFRDFDREL